MCEIHVLRATAEAIESNERYPLGERHAITIFSRQSEGEEPNYQLAAERAFSSGWDDFEFDTTRTLAISPEKVNLVQDEIFVQALNYALSNEAAVIVYADPINSSG
jgi:hypothetical protein